MQPAQPCTCTHLGPEITDGVAGVLCSLLLSGPLLGSHAWVQADVGVWGGQHLGQPVVGHTWLRWLLVSLGESRVVSHHEVLAAHHTGQQPDGDPLECLGQERVQLH